MPPYVESVYKNNKKILSDFDHKLWRDENIPNRLPPITKKALNQKAWAFVSDYMRFYFLEKYGGIYLDSDMIVLSELSPLLHGNCFAGINQERNSIYCGIIGAEPQTKIVKNVVKFYWEIKKKSFYFPNSPDIFTRVVESSSNEKINVYHPDVFYPKQSGLPYSYTFHRYDESWRYFVPLRRFFRKLGIVKCYHSLVGKNRRKDFPFEIIDKSNLIGKYPSR